jgi:hypothetical protein
MATKDPVKDALKAAAKVDPPKDDPVKDEPKTPEYQDVVTTYAKTMEELVADAKYQYDHGCFGVLQQADFFAAVAQLQGEV